MPADEMFEVKLRELMDEWVRVGTRVLPAIAAAAKMPWHQEEIVCYLTYGVTPYSDPLTLNLRSTIGTLTHELIHRILSEPQNRELWNRMWAYVNERYKEESLKTKTHIIVHAIHAAVLKGLFGEERYQAEKNVSAHSPDYARAWAIIETEGYEQLLVALTKDF